MSTIDITTTSQDDDEDRTRVILLLRGIYEDYHAALGSAHKKLWGFLGRVYELSSQIEADDARKELLIAAAKGSELVKQSPGYDPAEKSAAALLFVFAAGLDQTAATRSQWLTALKAAEAQEIPHTEGDFVRFMERVRGVAGARRSLSEEHPAFNLEQCARTFAETPATETLVTLPNGGGNATGGLVVLLALRSGTQGRDGSDSFRVVRVSTDEKLVASVADSIQKQETGRPLTEEAVTALRAKCLWSLNRLTLKEAGVCPGKVKSADVIQFQAAVHKLASVPALCDKLFEGKPSTSSKVGRSGTRLIDGSIQHTDHAELEEFNSEFQAVDPGRYIKGARPMALVPFEVIPNRALGLQAAVIEYIESRKRRRKVRPSSATGADLAAFFEKPEEVNDGRTPT